MPQAKLPDINAAFVKYRSHFLVAIEMKNYSAALASLNNINALLPDDYRVEINTKKYETETNTKLVAVCPECTHETLHKDVKLFDLELPSLDRLVFDAESVRAWTCPSCHKDVKLSNTKWIHDVIQLPAYLKIVPEAPNRKDGLDNRQKYKREMEKWCYRFLEELEYQLGLYRKEYVAQMQDTDSVTDEIGDEGEELGI